MCPAAPITAMVDTMDITMIATMNSCIISHDSISPTAGAMNMSGIIIMRNLPVSRTCESFSTPVHRAVKSMSMPYMLAGIGSGITLLRSSPTNDIRSIIPNCRMYFMVLSLFCGKVNHLNPTVAEYDAQNCSLRNNSGN